MIAKLLPVLLLLVGIGGGIGAALFTAPAPDAAVAEAEQGDKPHAPEESHEDEPHDTSDSEFIKLTNQFVVPLIKEDRVASMVVVSLSLEIEPGATEPVYAREPKLRDLFLRVLFDHANMGGFRGAFTQSDALDLLRGALREVAKKEMGKAIRDVLIVDIARQDS